MSKATRKEGAAGKTVAMGHGLRGRGQGGLGSAGIARSRLTAAADGVLVPVRTPYESTLGIRTHTTTHPRGIVDVMVECALRTISSCCCTARGGEEATHAIQLMDLTRLLTIDTISPPLTFRS